MSPYSILSTLKTVSLFAAIAVLFISNFASLPGKTDQLMGPLHTEAIKQGQERQIGPKSPQDVGALPATPPPLAVAQYVSNQRAKAPVAPGPTDQ